MTTDIGSRIRNIRKKKKTTLTQVAEKTGLSVAYLSNLERNQCSPTLENIQKICETLDIEIVKLLDDNEWASKVIHADERNVIFKNEGKVRYEAINFGDSRMTGEYIVTEPHCEYEEEWFHAYDEFGYVLKGELTIRIGDESFLMKEGDAFYIDAGKKHNMSNYSDEECISLWIKQAAK